MLNPDFALLIRKVDVTVSAPLSDEIKLRRCGHLICLGSEHILRFSQHLLDNLVLPSYQDDCFDSSIDTSFSNFLDSITQQSISTNFLSKYLIPQPRTGYCRSITNSVIHDIYSEVSEESQPSPHQIVDLAHDENIQHWISLIQHHLSSLPKQNSLHQISSCTKLSLAQVFLSGLFGDFSLKTQNNDFYESTIIFEFSKRDTPRCV